MGISSSDGNTVSCCGIDQCGAIEQEKVVEEENNKCDYVYEDKWYCPDGLWEKKCRTPGCANSDYIYDYKKCYKHHHKSYCCTKQATKSFTILTTKNYDYVKSVCPYEIKREEDYCYVIKDTTGGKLETCGYKYSCVQTIPSEGQDCQRLECTIINQGWSNMIHERPLIIGDH